MILDVINSSTNQPVFNSKIVYEMDFEKNKEFSFRLFNNSQTDTIQDLTIKTNMVAESYEILECTKNLGPGQSGTFRIKVYRKPLLESKNKRQERVTEFVFVQKMVLF